MVTGDEKPSFNHGLLFNLITIPLSIYSPFNVRQLELAVV